MPKTKSTSVISLGERQFQERVTATFATGNPVDEVAARGVRELLPVFVGWLNAEQKRGTEIGVVLATVPALVTSIAFTATLNAFTDKDAVAQMSDQLKWQLTTSGSRLAGTP